MDDHWLVRPQTIKLLWWVFAGVLATLVAMDLVIDLHGYFGIDATFGFYSWFGFLSCAGLVIFSKALGVLLKRRDTYYDS